MTWKNLDGTSRRSFGIGLGGIVVANDPSQPSPVGVAAIYNSLGVYGNLRAADPIYDNDVVTLQYLLGKLEPPPIPDSGLYEGAVKGLYG